MTRERGRYELFGSLYAAWMNDGTDLKRRIDELSDEDVKNLYRSANLMAITARLTYSQRMGSS